MNKLHYRPQDTNYLGTLASKLADLQGYDTLAYELIQNADDVKTPADQPGGATRILFDVCDAALIVENDGVFREIDFERMTEILHGGKEDEEGTTGAFGVGFVSVYQVTDAPEIFSANQHWTIRPIAERDKRIEIYDLATQETRFRLPWAFEAASATRQALRAAPVDPTRLDEIADDIADAVRQAALFLKQLQVLEVRRNGARKVRIERLLEENVLLLVDGEKPDTVWHCLSGDFNEQAEPLRQRNEGIRSKRKAIVTIAIPDEPIELGRLYATLPSQSELARVRPSMTPASSST